jgi:predicted GNAT family N-acyltransferase
MSTEFVSILTPPGDAVASYNRFLPPADQPASVPQLFIDAMEVREAVFVKEQHVPLANELDDQDPKSFHWVVYASVGASRSKAAASPDLSINVDAPPIPGRQRCSSANRKDASRNRSPSTARRVPVGTVRLVPPIHTSGTSRKDSHSSTSETAVVDSSVGYPHPTTFPGEPYVRLGRLATLAEYRGFGLSRLLINAALEYARNNGKIIFPPPSPAETEAAKVEGRPVPEPWKGLVIAHAQEERSVGLWKRWGFVVDEGMGQWDEEGMMHVGMWKRLELVEKPAHPLPEWDSAVTTRSRRSTLIDGTLTPREGVIED